ncbi:hypothetical protein [Acidithiobacillus sp. AMEEHan]|uniref:hypothetical protein n=1 Tax=Acidithiobacillus sp. AMEEHan TaxID=2994951 RepID=UPI0027E50633|nr:hypothetical protein [Acidithiobacillus sp. AMEEHan]
MSDRIVPCLVSDSLQKRIDRFTNKRTLNLTILFCLSFIPVLSVSWCAAHGQFPHTENPWIVAVAVWAVNWILLWYWAVIASQEIRQIVSQPQGSRTFRMKALVSFPPGVLYAFRSGVLVNALTFLWPPYWQHASLLISLGFETIGFAFSTTLLTGIYGIKFWRLLRRVSFLPVLAFLLAIIARNPTQGVNYSPILFYGSTFLAALVYLRVKGRKCFRNVH